jgi:hypothetical protein
MPGVGTAVKLRAASCMATVNDESLCVTFPFIPFTPSVIGNMARHSVIVTVVVQARIAFRMEDLLELE